MSLLYVTEHGATLGINGGSIVVTYPNGEKENVPKETVSAISVFGHSQLTSAMVNFCLEKGIKVSFFSMNGYFSGMLNPICGTNAERLKHQVALSQNYDERVRFAQKIIQSKMSNQLIVARRYVKAAGLAEEPALKDLRRLIDQVSKCSDIAEIMGYEGAASKEYFALLSMLVRGEFRFAGRSRRPAVDPVNAMLNYGYSMLAREIQGELENRGLNSFIGMIHEDRLGHAALASDLLEEWRAPIVDSTVMSLIQGNEIHLEDFCYEDDACRFTKEGMKVFLSKMEKKMHSEMKYLEYIGRPVSFRQALWHQAARLAASVDQENLGGYEPIRIR